MELYDDKGCHYSMMFCTVSYYLDYANLLIHKLSKHNYPPSQVPNQPHTISIIIRKILLNPARYSHDAKKIVKNKLSLTLQ